MPVELFFIFGIFSLVLGYVIGNFLPMMKKKPLDAKKYDSSSDILPDPAEQSGTTLPEAVPAPSADLLEIAHFWRHVDTNHLTTQIDNKSIEQGEQLTSDQHALLSLLLLDLGNWVGLEGRLQAVEKIQAEEEAAEGEDEPASKGFSPIGMIKDAFTADVFLPFADVSLADQIDPILQSMLIDSPLAEQGISLMDIEGRGMVVNVGLDMYDSVDDVPDDEIRALIKKAVAVWENRATRED